MTNQTPTARDARAYNAGRSFALKHPYSDFASDKDSSRLMARCPIHLMRFADVFKYGAQSIWREKGEL